MDVENMTIKQLDNLEAQITLQREQLSNTMDADGLSELINYVLGDANPADFDHPEAGEFVTSYELPKGTIPLKEGARGMYVKTERGDRFIVIVEAAPEKEKD
jgi:hypothetical protein